MSYEVELCCAHCGARLYVTGWWLYDWHYNYAPRESAKISVGTREWRLTCEALGVECDTFTNKTGKEMIAPLTAVVEKFGVERSGRNNTEEPTDGDIGSLCAVLLAWCKQHPSGVFGVL